MKEEDFLMAYAELTTARVHQLEDAIKAAIKRSYSLREHDSVRDDLEKVLVVIPTISLDLSETLGRT